MPLSFIYALDLETILASFEGVIFKVGFETVIGWYFKHQSNDASCA
jgi:hypothetical protein